MRPPTTRSRAIPATRFGNAYRVLLIVAGLLAIVGIADACRALFWLLLDGTTGFSAPAAKYAGPALRLVAWGLVAIASFTGWRRNVLPATWILVSLPLLGWALLLMQQYG